MEILTANGEYKLNEGQLERIKGAYDWATRKMLDNPVNGIWNHWDHFISGLNMNLDDEEFFEAIGKAYDALDEVTEEFEATEEFGFKGVGIEEVVGAEEVSSSIDSKERDLPVYHHYTHSMWSDGAAMFAAKQVKEEEFTLIVINKNIGAWEEYDIEPGGFMSGGWNYAPVPSDIGLSVWIKAKLERKKKLVR